MDVTASSYGVIFDLDGVLTDTAEFHYLAWQALADDESIPFDRAANERLRGVSRRDSLLLLLGEREVDEPSLLDMMERKNDLYLRSLQDMSPQDTLPGAIPLVLDAKRRGMRVAIGSSSKNAPFVLDKLGIAGLFDAVADGNSVEAAKPAPDLFLHAAELLDLPAARCVVIEDAASGVDAALSAGMTAVGIGPEERVGHAHHRWSSTAAVDLDAILPLETVPVTGEGLVADGWVLIDGPCPPDPLTSADGGWRADVDVPAALPVSWSVDDRAASRAKAGPGEEPGSVTTSWSHRLDIRYARHRRHAGPSGPIHAVEDSWFVLLEQPHLLVRRHVFLGGPGTTVRCLATIDVREWFGSSAEVTRTVDEVDGVRCIEVVAGDHRSILASATRVDDRVQVVDGPDRATAHEPEDGTVDHWIDVEVGVDGRVVVERFLSVHPGGASAAAAEAVRAAASSGFEPLLARHALLWEDAWASGEGLDGDPVARALARLHRAREVAGTAATAWPAAPSAGGT